MTVVGSPGELSAHIGETLGPTDWVEVAQDRIDLFADATGDHQWIHVDVERATAGPFGAPIAHGYLTLSMVNLFLPDLLTVEGISLGVNVGLEKVRFPNPVRVGSRVRGHFKLLSYEPLDGGAQMTVQATIELEGSSKPACVADTVSRYFP